MDRIIFPGRLTGTVTPPGSKSLTHRLILAAALARGTSVLSGVQLSRDLTATLDTVTALGARWHLTGETLHIRGLGGCDGPWTAGEGFSQLEASRFVRNDTALPRPDCGQSGTTLRLTLPVALVTAGGGIFTRSGRLARRPLGPYQDLFTARGIQWQQEGDTLTVRGSLTAGDYALPGDVSSQFFSGLLYALALVPGESHIRSTTPLQSAAYVDMTLAVLQKAGIEAGRDGPGRFWVRGGEFRPLREQIESDWSQAAFWLAARALGSPLTVEGLTSDSVQGDRVFAALQQQLSEPGDCRIDLSDCPDLLPPLALLAGWRTGETRFVNAGRLRYKESDRLSTVGRMLEALKVQCREESEGLTVWGGRGFPGGKIDGCKDHRIVMAAAIAGAAAREPVTITDSECVEKSYPAFWAEFERLGGKSHVL